MPGLGLAQPYVVAPPASLDPQLQLHALHTECFHQHTHVLTREMHLSQYCSRVHLSHRLYVATNSPRSNAFHYGIFAGDILPQSLLEFI
jgi:hypothetical protein